MLLEKIDVPCQCRVSLPGRPFFNTLAAFYRIVSRTTGLADAEIPAELHFFCLLLCFFVKKADASLTGQPPSRGTV